MKEDFFFLTKKISVEELRELSPSSLNGDQINAVEAILQFLKSSQRFFLLSGAAGTGKTYAIKSLVEQIDGKVVFTAPTNKATKVLRTTITTEDYTPECRTIYSLLGLKMEADGQVKKLKSPEDPVDLKSIKLIVVDEASMVNQALMQEIIKATENYRVKFLLLGDRNQLPPVNEKASMVWGLEGLLRAELHKVMRFDNQILILADRIKGLVDHPAPSISLEEDNDGIEGVWKFSNLQFQAEILKAARNGDFSDPVKLTKAIAWRNMTVNVLNSTIRAQIFDNSQQQRWLPGDRIILTSPAQDLEKKQIGCTDDEGTVERVDITPHPIYSDFICYNISVITDENKRINLWVLHERMEREFFNQQNRMAQEAKATPRLWKNYWEFSDSFHRVQHGYAITAHRAQGSTYEKCFVVWNDILLNRNRGEAFRCLYVACTRPKTKLILGAV